MGFQTETKFSGLTPLWRALRAALLLALALVWVVPAAQAQTVTRYTNTTDSATNEVSEVLYP